MGWKQILKTEIPDFSDLSDKSPSKEPFCHLSHFSLMNQELENESVLQEIKKAGVPKKWQDYLLERVEILVKYEGYSLEEAREEVVNMIPYYRDLN